MARDNTLLFVAAAVVVGIIVISNSANANPANDGSDNGTGANMVSQDQIQQTMGFEGFRATAYPDGFNSSGQQLYSIGYGHQIQPSETNLLTASITQAQGQQLLLNDLQNVVDYLNSPVDDQTGNVSPDVFTQGQFDALTDFGYNEGLDALSLVMTNFEDNGASAVPAELSQYIYWTPVAGGGKQVNQALVARRAANIARWNS